MTPPAVPLDEATHDTSGSKAATLATLRRAGIDIPDGFVIPFQEYRRHHPGRRPNRAHRPAAGPDPTLTAAIGSRLTALFGAADGGYVAVRSSAADEDGATASAAGQHDTILAVRGVDAVAAAVARCWASLHSVRAEAYRRQRAEGATGATPDPAPAMGVLVQRFVDADASGVLFTGTPRVVEAVPGLGAPLVGGRVTPDAWTLDDTGITDRRRGAVPGRLRRTGDRLTASPLSPQAGPCLTDPDVLTLDRIGRTVAQILGYDADVEWALTGGRPYVLQARPITAALPAPIAARASSRDHEDGPVIARGVPASPGRATGRACTLHAPRDFHRFAPGDIIVCRATDPAWTPLFTHAAGIVTETGGLLSHAAIVARELGIPAVLAVPGATRRFGDGTRLTVDGGRGVIEDAETG